MPDICPSNLIFIDRSGLMSTSFSSTLPPSIARAARKFRELFLEDAPLLPSAEADLRVHPRSFWFCEVFDNLHERLRQILRIGIRTAVRSCGVGFFEYENNAVYSSFRFLLPYLSLWFHSFICTHTTFSVRSTIVLFVSYMAHCN